MPVTTAAPLRPSPGSTAPTRPGVTCQMNSVRSRPLTTGCSDGLSTAPGNGSWLPFWPRRTLSTTSAGRCRSIRPSSEPISTPPEHSEGAAGRQEPVDHALGRSCGGLSTKIHLAADGRARPLAFTATADQAASDAPAFETVMATANGEAITAGARRASTARPTGSGTPSSGASTALRSGAVWPHERTNSPSPTRPHSTSPASLSGPDADQRDRI